MHVDAGYPLMDRFHNRPPSAKLSGARGFEGLGRIARAACATGANLPCVLQAPLARQFGVRTAQMGPVNGRGVTAKPTATSLEVSRARTLPRKAAAKPFHHWGRQLAVMTVTVKGVEVASERERKPRTAARGGDGARLPRCNRGIGGPKSRRAAAGKFSLRSLRLPGLEQRPLANSRIS